MLPNFSLGNWCRDPGLVDSCISSHWVEWSTPIFKAGHCCFLMKKKFKWILGITLLGLNSLSWIALSVSRCLEPVELVYSICYVLVTNCFGFIFIFSSWDMVWLWMFIKGNWSSIEDLIGWRKIFLKCFFFKCRSVKHMSWDGFCLDFLS